MLKAILAITLGAASVAAPAGCTPSPSGDLDEATSAVTTHLSIDRFIAGQGTTTVFTPPAPDQIGWVDSPPTVFALVDYTGLTNSTLGLGLGTQVSGTVLERTLRDGRVQVSVILHTKDALTWVSEASADVNTAPLLLGCRAQDLLADACPGGPALGESHLHVVFTIDASDLPPDAPLPDLVACINPGVGSCPESFALETLSFRAQARGPLHEAAGLGPEGARGGVTVSQTGVLERGGHLVAGDGFPAEVVKLHRAGPPRP